MSVAPYPEIIIVPSLFAIVPVHVAAIAIAVNEGTVVSVVTVTTTVFEQPFVGSVTFTV